MLVPPDNFGMVELGLYRCTKLESDHFPFLETLQLKSLIVLDAEKPPRLLKDFLANNHIDIYNLGGLKISDSQSSSRSGVDTGENLPEGQQKAVKDDEKRSGKSQKDEIEVIDLDNANSKTDQWMLIERNMISRAFELLLDKTKYNILLVDSTATLVGILRKVQKWNFNSIINEYRIYSSNSNKNNYYAENFLELVQVELISFELDEIQKRLEDQSKRNRKKSQDISMSNENQNSFDPDISDILSDFTLDSSKIRDKAEDESIDDEDIDDDLLSASPQIPTNLLKLVESDKKPNSKTSSSGSSLSENPARYSRTSRFPSSSGNEVFLSKRSGRKESFTDVKHPRTYSNVGGFKRKNSSVGFSSSPGVSIRKELEDSHRFDRSSRDETASSVTSGNSIVLEDMDHKKQIYDCNYYKIMNKYPVKFQYVNEIKLVLPPNEYLPTWFIKKRDYWEENFKKLNS
ncbi:Piso0_004108 [Millerozyma farinosa CBS 7064]|uniref:Piso0_004108 protein n=1 Tax=Pichia sorbitophila (strain ATCC MYA-4447 / BCRC 22081 / CBS 7064 / NBRC 10061 / NRRL Y-12695) TaxID=559304 RepID=G8YAE7_PICSO|nr:Piso0_004108 [Millerozyma farinosa CBS 7064]CCE84561.1 Piso0_004108 [Millerozyma farinosa CBS 7064]